MAPRRRARTSQSTVTVLDQQGSQARAGRLRQRPRQGRADLRRALHGRAGYVVTFRQIDPLYTLDLSRPDGAEGRRRAEDPRLLRLPAPGRREPAARRSGARARNVQASLFDVSNPAAPQRGRRCCSSAPGSTPVENEPHAFLYWAPTNLAVMPLQTLRRARHVHGRGRRCTIGPNALTEVGPDRPARRRAERGARADRALVRDRRPALHAVVPRACSRAALDTSAPLQLHGVLKRGAAAPGGEGFRAPRL